MANVFNHDTHYTKQKLWKTVSTIGNLSAKPLIKLLSDILWFLYNLKEDCRIEGQ